MNSSDNPLLQSPQRAFGAIPFDLIKAGHYLPALESAIEEARGRIAKLKANPAAPDFDNTMVALENATEHVDTVSETYFNMLSAEADESVQGLAKDFSSKLASFSSDLSLDAEIFAKIRAVYDAREEMRLNKEQLKLVENSYKSFVRNGALLPADKKERLRAIDQEQARLGPQYKENVLKATNAFEYLISDKAALKGLPDSAVEAAAFAARQKNKQGWLFTLEAPSYIPFVTYADDRAGREKMWRAYGSRAFGGAFDNQQNILAIARLRQERAALLGFPTHAAYVLAERMAETPAKVFAFLDRILAVAKPAAEKDVAEVRAFRKSTEGSDEIMPWDFLYYSEKLKKQKFNFDEEELRPYFSLEKVIDGVFEHARRLYDIDFALKPEVATYHPDVKVYEVTDRGSGKHVGLFYADFFPRPTKRDGAWMTNLRNQGLYEGKVLRPHVSIVCNFTKPTPSKPSLLTYTEVNTFFHEFGHALHGLLSDCTFRSLSGANVYWDFVELPSQIMENWTQEKESLDLYAAHFETGKRIPAELCKKIRETRTFQSGYYAVRQVGLSLLDLAWHAFDPTKITDVDAFETEANTRTRVLPKIPGVNGSCSFSHIWGGGYSAGYYSYKWAEVLDADAFEFFKEKGIFSKEVAKKFRDNILSRGGTEHPMDLYKRFRGREPDPDALLRRDGLL